MKKFINKAENFVDEMIEGILAAHREKLMYINGDLRCLVSKPQGKRNEKVGIVTGGGSGHLPLFLGYVGDGLLDGCAVGGVFQSPSSDQILTITKEVNTGKGVLYLYGNYGGDIINFDMAGEMADMEGIKIQTVLGTDDVASAKKGEEGKRRGVAGIFFLYKTAGAKASEGSSLEEVKRIAEKAASNTRTMGVATGPCIVPEVGVPSFSIGEDEMEIGMGIHGESGIRRGKLKPVDEIVNEMMDSIIDDLPYRSGDEVCVLINGLGATPKEEMYIIYRRVHKILEEKHIIPIKVYVGEYATSLEMSGFSISLMKTDNELKALMAKPANTPFFEQSQF